MARSILVVDDEASVRSVLRSTLERAGFTVSEASDGRQAVDLLQQEHFDLAIVDILLPERDGLETIMFLHLERPETKVIAITGSENELYLKTARLMGVSKTFTKPLRMQELQSVTCELLAV